MSVDDIIVTLHFPTYFKNWESFHMFIDLLYCKLIVQIPLSVRMLVFFLSVCKNSVFYEIYELFLFQLFANIFPNPLFYSF